MFDFKYLLDTSICVELLRGNEKVRKHCIEHDQQCSISIITAIELLYGAYHASEKYRNQELSKAKMLIDYYGVVGIDNIAQSFCQEKVRLERQGLIIEDFDLLIGMTAKVNGMIVVTNNSKHFNRIDELKIENWTE